MNDRIADDVRPRRCPWCRCLPHIDAGHVRYEHNTRCRWRHITIIRAVTHGHTSTEN